jgi:hypothetical protein
LAGRLNPIGSSRHSPLWLEGVRKREGDSCRLQSIDAFCLLRDWKPAFADFRWHFCLFSLSVFWITYINTRYHYYAEP